MRYPNQLRCAEMLIQEISARLPEGWSIYGDQVVDEYGHAILEVVRPLAHDHPDADAFYARSCAALQAMAYGPDVMMGVLRLIAAVYAADTSRTAHIIEELLDLIAQGFELDRERLEESVKPATLVVAERGRRAWDRPPARN